MNLLTHPSITMTASLESAATAVETAMDVFDAREKALKEELRRTPAQNQHPQDPDANRRWTMMYNARKINVQFHQELVRQSVEALAEANDALARVIEHAYREAEELMQRLGRDDVSAYRAALNLTVCDTLRVGVSAKLVYLKANAIKPVSIMERIDAESRLKACARRFIVQLSTGDGWKSVALDGSVTDSVWPLLTAEEAELLMSSTAESISKKPDVSYIVRPFNVIAQRPGSGSTSRFCEHIITAEGMLVARK